jgi:hypothetical protein
MTHRLMTRASTKQAYVEEAKHEAQTL